MKENIKFHSARVTFGHPARVAWCVGFICLFFFTRPGFASLPAIVVKGNLNFNGNGIMVDSFDSSVPGENINGQYAPEVSGNEGDIFAGSTGSNSVVIGNATIYGALYTGLTAAVSIGASGAVGTHFWIASGGTGIEPGRSFNFGSIALADVSVPIGLSYLTPGSGQIVTQVGPPTSQSFTNEMNLPTLSSNQTLVSVVTNTEIITMSTYPGPVPGLISNITPVITLNYPGDVPGLTTNCVIPVTVTNDPGPQPCLTVVSVGSITSADYPGPIYGLVTNAIITPPCITAITNPGCSDPITSATLPDSWCAVNGITTNCGATTTTTTAYPAPGTFCPGTVITNFNGSGRFIEGYTYYLIAGYIYTTNTPNGPITYTTNDDCPSTTNYTYTYPATNYFTYAAQVSYTYTVFTYSNPTNTYSYKIYTAWTYQTNFYDNILSGGNYFSSNALVGSTIVTGPSTLVMSDFGGNIAVAPGGSLTVYVQSGTCSININQITNQTGLVSNLVFLCCPGVTTLTLSGIGSFAGVVYAPEADASINGGGAAGMDFSGALAVNSLTALGDFRMHYDVALWELNLGVFVTPAPPPPVILLSPSITTNGQFQFMGNTQPGYTLVFECSTDLVNWIPIVTNTSGVSFQARFWPLISPGQCFFRTVYVQ